MPRLTPAPPELHKASHQPMSRTMSTGDGSSGSSVNPDSTSVTKQPRRQLGLLVKTAITLLVVGLVPLIVFGVVTLSQQRTELRRAAEQSMRNNTEAISALVDEWVDKNVRVLRAAALQPQVISMQGDQTKPVVVAIRQAYPWTYLVQTMGLDGKNIARSDELPLANYADRQYVRDILIDGKDLGWESVIGRSNGKPSLVISVPIRGANNALLGTMAASMSIEETSRAVATWKSGETGFAFLVDEKSKVLAHPRADYEQTQKQLPDHPLVAAFHADHEPHLLEFTENGKDILGYVEGDKNGWAVMIQQEEAELFGPLRATIAIGIALLVAAVLLVVAIAVVFSRVLIRPIVGMTNAADRMSLGELQVPIVVRGDDELALLARSLERLRKSMRAAMSRLSA
jgi:methyl-accepting chemotaxis protein